MSHFTVLVVGDPEGIEEQMIPFQEHACTGKCPKEYMKFEDAEEEERKEYETGTRKSFYCSSSSSHGQVVSSKFYAHLEGKNVGARVKVTFNKSDMDMAHYFKQGEYYHMGEAREGGKYPTKQMWVKVIEVVETNHPDNDVCFEGTVQLEVVAPPVEIPLKDTYATFEEYMEDYCGYSERDPETGKYGRWENPNRKWDWWEIGGRWAGHLLIKPEFQHLYADKNPNFSWGWDEKAKEKRLKECRVDSAKKNHVDWATMMKIAGEEAGKKYDFVFKNILKDIPPNEIWENYSATAKDDEDFRDKYWAQPRCQAWKEYEKKCFDARKKNPEQEEYIRLGFSESPDDFLCTREQYVREAERNAISTFAYLRGGKWAEKGEMGWFANVSNEKDSWPEIFYNLLQDVPGDEYVTILDCHI